MVNFEDDDFPPGLLKEKPKAQVIHIAPKSSIQQLDWPDLATKEPPPRRWAIRGWLGYGHTTLLVGAGGIGKTLLGQQAGSALALGVPHIGEIEEPHRVLMWACEDDHDELWRRQVNIARYFKAGLEAFTDNFVLVPRHGQDNALCTTEFGRLLFSPLIAILSEQANDLRSDVVILDNVAQLYGASENDRHAVTAFLNNLSGALGNRAILLLAHPSRASGSEFSGSGAWENVARTRLYLGSKLPDTPPDPDEDVNLDQRYLCRRKANYSDKDWRRFIYENGVLVPEAIEPGQGLIGHLRELAAERIVLEAIPKLLAMGLHGNEGGRSPNYLPKLIMEYKLGNGQSKPEISSAMRKLMTDGKLTKSVVGLNANRTERFGLVIAQ